MAYQFNVQEALADGVRRIVREQVAQALAGLQQVKDRDKGIYEARKCSKRLRALLRFVRLSLGETRYQEENAILRDFANALAPARDSFVVVQTLDKVLANVPVESEYEALRHTWLKQAKRLRNSTLDDSLLIQRLQDDLNALQARLNLWRLQPANDFGLFAPNLRTTYKRGQSIYRQLTPDSQAPAFHEWRKAVKHLWYQTTLLQAFGGLEEQISQWDTLGDKLGTAHDYAVLEERLLALDPAPVLIAPLLEATRQARHTLEQSALVQGAALYPQRALDYVRQVAYHFYLSRTLTP